MIEMKTASMLSLWLLAMLLLFVLVSVRLCQLNVHLEQAYLGSRPLQRVYGRGSIKFFT